MGDLYHAVVWIDHHEAKIFRVDVPAADHATLHSTHPHEHLHHKANTVGSGHAPVDHAFLERVAQALMGSGSILITGPASAKDELAAHLKREHADLGKHISAVETLDHPTDGEIVALARKFFRGDDRMHSQLRS